MTDCSVDTCDRSIRSAGLCMTHYKRQQRGINLTTPIRKKGQGFDSWVEKTPTCWVWRGARMPAGYGRFHVPGAPSGTNVLAHRFAWERATQQRIPDGMQLDHTCRNTSCVNPSHLEVVTAAENLRRAREATK